MVGGEEDENVEENKIESGLENKLEKKKKLVVKKMEIKTNKESGENNDEKIKELLSKIR